MLDAKTFSFDVIQDENVSCLDLTEMHCPDQALWIFVGVLVGLVSGTVILWLLNCFRIPTQTKNIPSASA